MKISVVSTFLPISEKSARLDLHSDLARESFTKSTETTSPLASISSKFLPEAAAILHPRVVEVRDQLFKIASISPTGQVDWELKDGVVAKNAVEVINEVTKSVYGKTLIPTRYTTKIAGGYDNEDGPRNGNALPCITNSENKNHDQMEEFLRNQGLSLATRYNCIVSLNVGLLLTGTHPMEKFDRYEEYGIRLRDADGVLCFNAQNRLSSDDGQEIDRALADKDLLALGCSI